MQNGLHGMNGYDVKAHARTPASEGRRVLRWLAPLGVLVLALMSTLACRLGIGDVDDFSLSRTFRLEQGDQRAGDQVVFAYDIDFQDRSAVDGDLTLTGNHVTLDAAVQGDVVVVANRLTIGRTAFVSGDVVACVKTLDKHAIARIEGELRHKCVDDNSVSLADAVESGWNSWRNSAFFRISTVIIGAMIFGALAALGTLLFPRMLRRMSQAVQQVPVLAGGVGLVTVLLAVGLTVLYAVMLKLVVPLVLLPLVLLLWMLVLLLSLLGWLALAEPFGVLLLRLLRVDNPPHMITAVVGGVALALLLRVWSIFLFTPWFVVLGGIIFSAIGLGPVLLTRAGTKPYARPRFFHRAG